MFLLFSLQQASRMRNLNIQSTKIIKDIKDPKAQEESYATSISRAKKVIEF
jgi:hypothetical protein